MAADSPLIGAIGKLIGVPYLPVTPWLLPLPAPVPLSVHYGEPLRFEGTGDEDDETIEKNVDQVKLRIGEMIERSRR